MEESENEARVVIEALRGFKAQIEKIMSAIEGKRHISSEEKEELQKLLTLLKGSLKEAAKHGTVSRKKQPRTHFEQAYFMPAVFEASANFNVAVNSHPIKANWCSCLYSIEMDITHLLSQLEEEFPDTV